MYEDINTFGETIRNTVRPYGYDISTGTQYPRLFPKFTFTIGRVSVQQDALNRRIKEGSGKGVTTPPDFTKSVTKWPWESVEKSASRLAKKFLKKIT